MSHVGCFTMEKQSLLSIEQGLGCPRAGVVAVEERKDLLYLPGSEPSFLSCPAHSVVTVLITLSWHCGCHSCYLCPSPNYMMLHPRKL